jgi:hypothetical protein
LDFIHPSSPSPEIRISQSIIPGRDVRVYA